MVQVQNCPTGESRYLGGRDVNLSNLDLCAEVYIYNKGTFFKIKRFIY